MEIRLAKIIIEELKEVEENKLRIDKEIEGLEARIAEERECLEYEEWDTIEKRIEPIKKELAEMKKIQKFAEERLLEIRKKKLTEAKEKEKSYLKDIFAALVMDDKEFEYQLYLVNQSDSISCSRISSLTGAFESADDDLVETNRVEKEYGLLKPKSFILLEEDTKNWLDMTIWYVLDIYLEGKKRTVSFSFRYPHGTGEKLPVLEKVGHKIELK